jgi:hypothetical protein
VASPLEKQLGRVTQLEPGFLTSGIRPNEKHFEFKSNSARMASGAGFSLWVLIFAQAKNPQAEACATKHRRLDRFMPERYSAFRAIP